MTNFNDQTIIISGGTGTIGQALGKSFVNAGGHVFLLDTKPASHAISGCTFIECNVTVPEELQRSIQHIHHKTGRIDVAIANAAVYSLALIADTKAKAAENLVQTNVLGSFYFCQAILPYMQKTQFGRILLMGSEQALIGRAHSSLYGMSKAALVQFTKSCSAEYAKDNILINCLCPSTVAETDMTDQCAAYFQKQTGLSRTVQLQQFSKEQPTGKMITLDEVVFWSLQLCSTTNRSVTGQTLLLDAGLTTMTHT